MTTAPHDGSVHMKQFQVIRQMNRKPRFAFSTNSFPGPAVFSSSENWPLPLTPLTPQFFTTTRSLWHYYCYDAHIQLPFNQLPTLRWLAGCELVKFAILRFGHPFVWVQTSFRSTRFLTDQAIARNSYNTVITRTRILLLGTHYCRLRAFYCQVTRMKNAPENVRQKAMDSL